MKKIVTLCLCIIVFSCKKETGNVKLKGAVFGTTYSIQYFSETNFNFEKQIDSLFYVVNKSLSTYQTNSIVSIINRNEPVKVDNHFRKVFNISRKVYNDTEGAFDPTIGGLVNAWNFGPEGKIANLDSLKIKDLMPYVGFDQVGIRYDLVMKPHLTYLDFNAIAKGYGVDVIADFLESKNITNYLVEIGGEIKAKGKNIVTQTDWKIGVERPNFNGKQSILKTISLHNEAMATSGTYRKFKVDNNGNRYAHIINTKTGYPSKTNVLSVSVIANNCTTADAYATAFQAMGIEKVTTFLKSHPELKVFFVFENENKELETRALNGFPEN